MNKVTFELRAEGSEALAIQMSGGTVFKQKDVEFRDPEDGAFQCPPERAHPHLCPPLLTQAHIC